MNFDSYSTMHSKSEVLNSASSMYFLDKNVCYTRTFFDDRIVGNFIDILQDRTLGSCRVFRGRMISRMVCLK